MSCLGCHNSNIHKPPDSPLAPADDPASRQIALLITGEVHAKYFPPQIGGDGNLSMTNYWPCKLQKRAIYSGPPDNGGLYPRPREAFPDNADRSKPTLRFSLDHLFLCLRSRAVMGFTTFRDYIYGTRTSGLTICRTSDSLHSLLFFS